MKNRVVESIVQLVFAAMFWGFGFVAVVWALKELSPAEITFGRFAIGGVVGLLCVLPMWHRLDWKNTLKLSGLAAFFLAGTLILQTTGLQYTTATKSGFITTLYVVLVPLIEAGVRRRRISADLWAMVFLALLGTALIMRLEFRDLNRGDLLTLGCMVFASLHIFWMGRVSPRTAHPFFFNSLQSAWAAMMLSPLVKAGPLWEKVSHVTEWEPKVIVGMLMLSLGSTTLAFYLQVRAQAFLSATVASILFLLESPFALIFAFLLLGERLTVMEAAGAILIFMAALLVSIRTADLASAGPKG